MHRRAGPAIDEAVHLGEADGIPERAEPRLEEIRAAVWSAAPLVDRLGVSGSPLSPPQSGSMTTFADEAGLPDPYAGYSRQVRIFDCGLPPGCGAVISTRIRQVTVTVAYRPTTTSGTASLDKTVLVTTLVAQR